MISLSRQPLSACRALNDELLFQPFVLSVEQRCYTFGTIALVVGITSGVAGLATTGLSLSGALTPSQPAAPDLGSANETLSDARATLAPIQRGLAAAQQTGGRFTYRLGGSDHTVDFTGYGQGDIESTIAKQTAKNNLALSQKYDSQFIDQALAQEKLADPESFAAKAEESKLIQNQINRPLNEPVADLLNSQVQDTLNAANKNDLTAMDTGRLNAAVAEAQAARGGTGNSPAADFKQPLVTGFAGETRKTQAAQGAMGLLASGSSPEDIAYRREQQNLANLSAEVNGKTPQSQFASLSGAQAGPTPMTTFAALPTQQTTSDNAGAQSALANWNTSMRYQNAQVNPWVAGLSGVMGLGSAAASFKG